MKEMYILGKDSHVIIGTTNYPETTLYWDNNPVMLVGRCICLIFKTEDGETYRVVIDSKQAKAISKVLLMQRKELLRPKMFSIKDFFKNLRKDKGGIE